MQPTEVYIQADLPSPKQHYVKLQDSEENGKLFELLNVLEFNQVLLNTFSS